MSDYALATGGSLKLKGGVAEGGIVKKYVVRLARRHSYINPFSGRKRNPGLK
jgi:hypothetical protein